MTVKKFDQQKLQQCVDMLDAFARSGLSVQAFAQAQGLSYGQLRGWLAHGLRWRAQLAGETYTPPAQARAGKASGFIQLKVQAGRTPNAPPEASGEAAARDDRRVQRCIKRALHHYIKPEVLCIDELGYLPIDKFVADCLFQIISHRYEHRATLLTTNRVYKQWASIFNNDSVLTSALLDRLLHHTETVRIEGKRALPLKGSDRTLTRQPAQHSKAKSPPKKQQPHPWPLRQPT